MKNQRFKSGEQTFLEKELHSDKYTQRVVNPKNKYNRQKEKRDIEEQLNDLEY